MLATPTLIDPEVDHRVRHSPRNDSTREEREREIVFGMCLLGLSVAVDVFTLVCISVERYLAICRPLLILKLRSIDFSGLLNGLILLLIWSLGLLIALPNLFMYNLCSLPQLGRFKCEKTSLKQFDERVYMITLLGETLFLSLSLVLIRNLTLVLQSSIS